ncbi:hypothetical protein NCAS_0C03450 [Naumovozyma castellii]|uniref:Long chronological lifespan protein 2 n=1 Tax=Naumovozyma castellii TaxID=27288 RepID=G0VCX4_NAUCA|nr:hypothetical protein NCAS_0C03450 [Naumovozyma castellii CBS 4309]CCC69335.1 hypothetical protein NCAS_0C03450 [Naumovozyma castellii CBS 4309]
MKLISFSSILFFLLSITRVSAFFQHQQQQQQQQQQRNIPFEEKVLDNACDKYLCPDTLECVRSVQDCPCPFPKSQLKCKLSSDRYVCISKPATHDQKLNEIYDDPVKGPKASVKGMRDCGWVSDAYNI